MQNIALVINETKAEAINAAHEILDIAKQYNANIYFEKSLAGQQNFISQDFIIENNKNKLDIVVALGGDGTILKAAELARELDIELIGINLGTIGFLAEGERTDLLNAIKRILSKDYVIENRLCLEANYYSLDGFKAEGDNSNMRGSYRFNSNIFSQSVLPDPYNSSWALNEITIEKTKANETVSLGVAISGNQLCALNCDGVMASTPTGSTGYAFSSGGPIVWPQVESILFSPLNAHALFGRHLILPPVHTLDITIKNQNAVSWADSRRKIDIFPISLIRISASKTSLKLARLKDFSFAARLQSKFHLPLLSWKD